MNENSFLMFHYIFVTASPTTPVIYSLKCLVVFNFWALIFQHSVAVTALKISLYQGLVSDSWRLKLLKIGPHLKEILKLFYKLWQLKYHPVNFRCLYTVNCVAAIKIFLGSILIQRHIDSSWPRSSQQSTQQSTYKAVASLYPTKYEVHITFAHIFF